MFYNGNSVWQLKFQVEQCVEGCSLDGGPEVTDVKLLMFKCRKTPQLLHLGVCTPEANTVDSSAVVSVQSGSSQSWCELVILVPHLCTREGYHSRKLLVARALCQTMWVLLKIW